MKSVVNPSLVKKVSQYTMPPAAFELLGKHEPLILVGTTGAGKNTIAKYIEQNSNWRQMVSTTTRPPREGELNGKDYWFVSEKDMEAFLDNHGMIEVKQLHNQQVSGTSIAAFRSVIESGHKPILLIDIHGTLEIAKHVENLRPFFILPPSFDEWTQRLEERGPMSHVEKSRRFRSAIDELGIALRSEKILFVINREISQVGQEILASRSDPTIQHNNRELAKNLLEEIQAHHF